jgi:hypothetical protein
VLVEAAVLRGHQNRHPSRFDCGQGQVEWRLRSFKPRGNPSGVGAAASTTRYYLSLDAVKDAGDVILSGTRSVLALATGTNST